MKLGKTSRLLLLIGVFIIAFASLGITRSRQVHERNRLDDELSQAELRLNQLQLKELLSRQEELKERLSQTGLELEATKALLSRSPGSITVSDNLLHIAESSRVKVTQLSVSGLARDNLEKITFLVLPLTVRVEGEINELVSFITTLNRSFTMGVVKSVEISIPKVTGDEKPSANVQLVIYTYPDA